MAFVSWRLWGEGGDAEDSVPCSVISFLIAGHLGEAVPPGADRAPAPGDCPGPRPQSEGHPSVPPAPPSLELRFWGERVPVWSAIAAFARFDPSRLDPVRGGGLEFRKQGEWKREEERSYVARGMNICVQPPCGGQNEAEVDDATRERVEQHGGGGEEGRERENKAGLQDRLREGCIFVLFCRAGWSLGRIFFPFVYRMLYMYVCESTSWPRVFSNKDRRKAGEMTQCGMPLLFAGN